MDDAAPTFLDMARGITITFHATGDLEPELLFDGHFPTAKALLRHRFGYAAERRAAWTEAKADMLALCRDLSR